MIYSEFTTEQNILLHLLRRNLYPSKEEGLSKAVCESADWNEVFLESLRQAVPIMAFDGAAEYKAYIPDEVFQRWLMTSGNVFQTNERVAQAQKELLAILEDGGYRYLILKGLAAASYYPRPEFRGLGDVDFLVDADKTKEVGKLLVKNGCKKWGCAHGHHIAYQRSDAHLELHFEVAGIPYGEAGERVRSFLKDVLENGKRVELQTGDFVAPKEPYHGLVLLLHMQHHMLGEGLGLRHLCDWACFVERTANEPFWKETLLPFVKEIGLFTYAAVMTKTCALYLGATCPEWAVEADESVCAEVLDDIFKGGNFGGKDRKRAKSAMLISERGKGGTNHSKTYNLCHGFHAYTRAKHPSCQKCFLLYPVFYVVEGFRYLGLMLAGKRHSPFAMRADADERKAVYDKLHVFEKEEKQSEEK